MTPTLRKMRPYSSRSAFKQIKRADGGHDERAGDDGAGHVVHVLQQAPGIEEQLPEAEHLELPVGQAVVGHGMLHPGVGDDDEEAGDPRAEKDHEGGEPVHDLARCAFRRRETGRETPTRERS